LNDIFEESLSKGGTGMLSRLRKLVFKVRSQHGAERLVETMRRLNRLARLMTIMQNRMAGPKAKAK